MVMSFLSAWNQCVLLKADFWAVMQRHRWWQRGRGEGTIRAVFGLENQRSIICQGLGNDYTMAALSFSLALSFLSSWFLLAFVKTRCSDACPTT